MTFLVLTATIRVVPARGCRLDPFKDYAYFPCCERRIEKSLEMKEGALPILRRKDFLASALAESNRLVVIDHLQRPPPRVARFIQRLSERIPVWVLSRSNAASELGHAWPFASTWTTLEVGLLSQTECFSLIQSAVDVGYTSAQAVTFSRHLYRMSAGKARPQIRPGE